ncbi:MAG: DUF4116 domain-containing protein [Fusobacteriaceae bacterium]
MKTNENTITKFSDEDLRKIFDSSVPDSKTAKKYKKMPSELQEDREFAIKILKINKYVVFYLPENMYNDYEVMKVAFSTENSGYLIKDEELPYTAKKNINVIKAAVMRNPEVLYFVMENFDDELEGHEDIMDELQKLNDERWEELDSWESFYYKDEFLNLCNSEGYIIEAGGRNYYTLEDIIMTSNDATLCYDSVREEFFFDKHGYSTQCLCGAYYENGDSCDFCDSEDRNFVLKDVKNGGRALCYADDSFRKDKDIVLEAVKNAGFALCYADDSLKEDKEILEAYEESKKRLENEVSTQNEEEAENVG